MRALALQIAGLERSLHGKVFIAGSGAQGSVVLSASRCRSDTRRGANFRDAPPASQMLCRVGAQRFAWGIRIGQ
jgi:hypothetical protein